MKIATWNVNSIRARLPAVVSWLGSASPDIVLLQEIKTTEGEFPFEPIGDLGYNCEIVGEKSYNGVAILSRFPIDVEETSLPGNTEDEQARYLEAFTGGVRVSSIYLPNGNPAPGPKFTYKLEWMEHLIRHVQHLLEYEERVVLGGDYNVCPDDQDVHDPAGWADNALCLPESRALFRRILWSGYTDAFRTWNGDGPDDWTFWDYQGGAWYQNHGVRIDHLLLSPHAADTLVDCQIDRTPRGKPRASDHTPIWCELDD